MKIPPLSTNCVCLVASLLIGCLGLLPKVEAVSPAPDGGYPGENTAEGTSALLHLNGGTFNTALGWSSLGFNVTGNLNTGVGAATLLNNTADNNTATGAGALLSNTTGEANTANGAFALFNNTTGFANTAIGFQALFSNTTAVGNTAIGDEALQNNTTGFSNTATGGAALRNNTTGSSNTAFGEFALQGNSVGVNNTAIGFEALENNTAASNTGVGDQALSSNTDGFNNTSVGAQALGSNTTGNGDTAIGANALGGNTTGSDNTALGDQAGTQVTTATNVICIGAIGANVSFTTWIGNIYETTPQSGTTLPVVVSNDGQLGTTSSSARFKKDVKPMNKASEAILALKPVTFHYKTDKTSTAQFGLIAEDVAEVNPDLVVHDKSDQVYAVRYDAVNAMLLNEFLKEHRAFLAEERTLRELEANAVRQQKQIEALTMGLQKVNDELEMTKAAARTVVNDR